MRTVIYGALGAIALAGLTTAAEARCIRASGEATAITDELSRDLAKVALSNSISNWGGRPAGRTRYSCKYEFIFSTCRAHQRACK